MTSARTASSTDGGRSTAADTARSGSPQCSNRIVGEERHRRRDEAARDQRIGLADQQGRAVKAEREHRVRDHVEGADLHRIGALEPYAVVAQGEYWRLFTALFLHGGFLHLAFNLFALYVFGPPLEGSIGTIRFLACYLISGLASSAGVVVLNEIGLVHVFQVIGASGCIMGVVGAWAGFLLRHHHAPFAKQQLANVGLIVAIQIAFDLSTPQVSMAAHMCGLVAGFFLGLLLAPRVVAGGGDPGWSY